MECMTILTHPSQPLQIPLQKKKKKELVENEDEKVDDLKGDDPCPSVYA